MFHVPEGSPHELPIRPRARLVLRGAGSSRAGWRRKLAALAEAGENLEYVGTRRLAEKPGCGVLYIAPVTGPDQVRAGQGGRHARGHKPGRHPGRRATTRPGLAHRLTHEWALAGISFQGLTMAVVADKFVGYAAFDNSDDANKAATILANLGTSNGAPAKTGATR